MALNLSIPITGWSTTGESLLGEFVEGLALLINLTGISKTIGGTSVALDSIETVDSSAGIRVIFRHESGADLSYLLIDSPGAEAVPWVIRPDDYHVTTNPIGWELTDIKKNGILCTWDSNGAGGQIFRRIFTLIDGDGDAQITADQSAAITINT
jgi:hypothetical protein